MYIARKVVVDTSRYDFTPKFSKIYIIKNGFCGSVCPDTRHASISRPISKLSTSTDSPGTGAAVKNTLDVIGGQTKKF